MKPSGISRFALALGLALSFWGCSEGQKTKELISKANSDHARMESIEDELRAQNIFIMSPEPSQAAVQSMDLVNTKKVEALLTEFIDRGENVVKTALRSDVRFPEPSRKEIEAKIALAGQLRDSVRARLQNLAGSEKPRSLERPADISRESTDSASPPRAASTP